MLFRYILRPFGNMDCEDRQHWNVNRDGYQLDD
jgi:hypothetical protein